MKKLENLIFEACAVSVLLTSVFFIFAWIGLPEITPAIQIGKYFLILLFSLLITAAKLLFSVKGLKKPLALLLHYAIALVAFSVIFFDFSTLNGMRIFILIVCFTLFYAAIWGIVIVTRRILARLDKQIEAKRKPEEKVKYTPRYK